MSNSGRARRRRTGSGCRCRRGPIYRPILWGSGRDVGAQIVASTALRHIAARHRSRQRPSEHAAASVRLVRERRARECRHQAPSQKAALIRFRRKARRGRRRGGRDRPRYSPRERSTGRPGSGYFVDVKTLAAALTAVQFARHLSELWTSHEEDRLRGARRSLTLKCSLRPPRRADHLGMSRRSGGAVPSFTSNETGPYDLYSEASLGKAYLRP